MKRLGLLRWAAGVCGLFTFALVSGCGSGGPSPSDVATAAAATSCNLSAYAIVSQLTGKQEAIFDCTFPDGSVKCVTYANGIATDSTEAVRLLFANKLGPGRPPCLEGQAGSAAGTTVTSTNCSAWPIVGFYFDNAGNHGFLLKRGKFTTINDPNASETKGGTLLNSINTQGVGVGQYWDSKGVSHAYFRSVGGTFASFDAPGAGTNAGQGTQAWGLSDDGSTMTGTFVDSKNVSHGFIRTKNGGFTTIDDPNAGSGPPLPKPSFLGTRDLGTVYLVGPFGGIYQGAYVDAKGVNHGFLYKNGTYTTIDDPYAGIKPEQGTITVDYNLAGVVLGYYAAANGLIHGFTYKNGTYTAVPDAPGAGTNPGQGTEPGVITNMGTIIGSYINAKGNSVGYIDRDGIYANLPRPPGFSFGEYAVDTPTNSGC